MGRLPINRSILFEGVKHFGILKHSSIHNQIPLHREKLNLYVYINSTENPEDVHHGLRKIIRSKSC